MPPPPPVPDTRVRAAIENWAPRFVANGVDFNDFRRTTARIAKWDAWLDEWLETGDEHRTLAQEAESERSAGEAWVRAAVAYHFAKFVWVVDVERNHDATRHAIDALRRAHAALDPTARRIEIEFDGATLAANLRRPRGGDTRLLKHWGFGKYILDDAGDRVMLRNYAGTVLDCYAWGDAGC